MFEALSVCCPCENRSFWQPPMVSPYNSASVYRIYLTSPAADSFPGRWPESCAFWVSIGCYSSTHGLAPRSLSLCWLRPEGLRLMYLCRFGCHQHRIVQTCHSQRLLWTSQPCRVWKRGGPGLSLEVRPTVPLQWLTLIRQRLPVVFGSAETTQPTSKPCPQFQTC